ncbi:NACHT domain- and WD repeat-containing protein 1 [Spea bombifrons]|uniref:NACHT domain- and WD repeat-containing protein 1 n=1 Tax=Spea bombifrons TaxID=233779 RepID=UPI002349678C|nr:NACHT domain- and WD repeat-containing protein 1 [Spea bombifrons]
MDINKLKDVMRGKETTLPSKPSNAVRIFISSTFSDMAEERDALMELAYPEIQAFCQKNGLTFEVVDMRWGVRDYATVDHMTTELCLKEIESCSRISMGPFLIAMIGERYGFRPIPRIISEEEFSILYNKVQKDQSDAQLLTQWFWKDTNSAPPIFILQPITTHLIHYADTNPVHKDLQAEDIKKWKKMESQLSQALRLAATEAEKEGLITPEQKHKYFKSVTEYEIEYGFLASKASKSGSTIIFREVKDMDYCKDKFHQLIDVREDGSSDKEAQELLGDLKERILRDHPDQVKRHVVEMSKEKSKCSYLQELCGQVITVVSHQILSCLPNTPTDHPEPEVHMPWLGWLMQEVTHHLTMSRMKSEIFCGRQELLQCIMSHVKDDHVCSPLVIYGASGSGKTALLCKVFEILRLAAPSDGGPTLILRLLGTSPQSSEIHDVLKSICYQVCLSLDLSLPSAQITNIYSETVRFFHQLLNTASETRAEPLVVILDSLDQLSTSEGAHHLHWLPKECPANVHIIVSTLPDEGGILNTLREFIPDPQSFLEVQPLSPEQGGQMIEMLLSSVGRKLTTAQLDIVLSSFKMCGQPLQLRLAFDEAKRWSSYTSPSELKIATSTKDAVHQLYQRLEQIHGKILVSHALGYIVTSRSGLSEAELKDVLSLDDDVLADIYQYWAPPSNDVIKFPSLSWTRLRLDLEGYLVERQADGSTVLGLYHRQFIEVVQDSYLTVTEKAKRHYTLSEYFMGKWSQGTKRPIHLPLIKKYMDADRKVAPQPLWFSDDVPNLRKMSELPYHLLKAERIEDLQRDILGNLNWIASKIVSCGINSVIKDFEMSVEYVGNSELYLVRDALRLFQPTINFIEGSVDPCIIYTEILARLHFFQQSCPSVIGEMCRQCLAWFDKYPNPTFIPMCGFFQPPGGPLQTTITGFQKGVTVMELCHDQDLLVVGSEDGTMIVWNIKDIEVIHTLIGHSASIRCAKVFGSGTRAVSGSMDHTLLLWNLVTGKTYLSIHEDHTVYENAYLHVDEKMGFIYSAAGSQVNVWHIESGDPVLCLSPGVPGFPVQVAVLSPQQLLITVTEGGTVHLWDSSTRELRGSRQLPGVFGKAADPVCSCVIPRHGKMVVGFKNGALALISSGGGVSTEMMPSALTFVVVADDESLFAAGFGKQVQVFLADSNAFRTFLSSYLEHDDIVESAVFNSEKDIIVTGSRDETIRIWSLSQRGALLDTLHGMGVPVNALAITGRTIISSSCSAYYLKLWNMDYDKQHKTVPPFQDRSGCVAVSDAGKRVYFPRTGDKHKIAVWDSEKGLMANILEASSNVTCLEVAECKRVLFCGLSSGTVLAFPLDQTQDVACIPPPDHNLPVLCLSLSKCESKMAVAYQSFVHLYDVTRGDPIPTLEGPIGSVHVMDSISVCQVAALGDGRLFYGTSQGELYLLNSEKEEGLSLGSHRSKITCLEISNKEMYALSGSEDAIQRLWNLQTGEWEHEMCYKGFFFHGIDCACFSPDDRYIYTGSKDRAIKVWDVSNGSLLAVQYVYATVTRIIPTIDGFIGTTRLGYVIRERFQCPRSINPKYNPLQNIKASCTVNSMKSRDTQHKAAMTSKIKKSRWRCGDQTKRSQICHIV